jgi:hypothetical protein
MLLALTACPSSAPQSTASSQEAASKPEPVPAPDAKPASASDPAPDAPSEMGRIGAGPLPLVEMLGAAPPDVEANLGEPFAKGMMRDTCVRFLPERTWFRCSYGWQRYRDETGTFTAVQVAYEDGAATAIALEGVPAPEGAESFDPRLALVAVGIELPGEPDASSPAEDTQLWSWFNSAARLRIHGRQYRVEVSSVGGRWETSKVEVMLNDELTPEERERVIEK